MIFDFAKATNITTFAKKNFEDMYSQYERVYIVPDTNDYHILRILKGYGEDYELNEDSFVLEHQMIPKNHKRESISSTKKLYSILEQDDGGNYDYKVKRTFEECVKIVDGGFGIN